MHTYGIEPKAPMFWFTIKTFLFQKLNPNYFLSEKVPPPFPPQQYQLGTTLVNILCFTVLDVCLIVMPDKTVLLHVSTCYGNLQNLSENHYFQHAHGCILCDSIIDNLSKVGKHAKICSS